MTRVRALIVAVLPLALAACGTAPLPPANDALWRVKDGGGATATAAALAPLVNRPVMVGSEGPSLPACPSVSKVKAPGTNVYWAPGETRVVKAALAAGESVALCEASDDDAWFGIVFAVRGTPLDECRVNRTRAEPSEYQGPCRWGWIRGGTLALGA